MQGSLGKYLVCCLAAALLATTAAAGDNDSSTPAEKIRAVLDQPIKLDFVARRDAPQSSDPRTDIANHLTEKTGIKFVVDQRAHLGNSLDSSIFELKADNIKLSVALRRCLSRHMLTYIILEECVAITAEEWGPCMQLRQLVSVQFDNVPLSQALKDLRRTAPYSLVVDPKVKWLQEPISVELENTQLEVAIRIMVEQAGLKVLCIDNAVYVTTPERADRLLAEERGALAKRVSYPQSMPSGPPPGFGPLIPVNPNAIFPLPAAFPGGPGGGPGGPPAGFPAGPGDAGPGPQLPPPLTR